MCVLVLRTSVCVYTCDSAVETGEGDVEKFLAGVELPLPQARRTEGGGEEKRLIMRCLRRTVCRKHSWCPTWITVLWGCPDYVVLPLILIQVLKYSVFADIILV